MGFKLEILKFYLLNTNWEGILFCMCEIIPKKIWLCADVDGPLHYCEVLCASRSYTYKRKLPRIHIVQSFWSWDLCWCFQLCLLSFDTEAMSTVRFPHEGRLKHRKFYSEHKLQQSLMDRISNLIGTFYMVIFLSLLYMIFNKRLREHQISISDKLIALSTIVNVWIVVLKIHNGWKFFNAKLFNKLFVICLHHPDTHSICIVVNIF